MFALYQMLLRSRLSQGPHRKRAHLPTSDKLKATPLNKCHVTTENNAFYIYYKQLRIGHSLLLYKKRVAALKQE